MCFVFYREVIFSQFLEKKRGEVNKKCVCMCNVCGCIQRDGADALVDFLNFLRDGTALGAFLLGRGLAS